MDKLTPNDAQINTLVIASRTGDDLLIETLKLTNIQNCWSVRILLGVNGDIATDLCCWILIRCKISLLHHACHIGRCGCLMIYNIIILANCCVLCINSGSCHCVQEQQTKHFRRIDLRQLKGKAANWGMRLKHPVLLSLCCTVAHSKLWSHHIHVARARGLTVQALLAASPGGPRANLFGHFNLG